MRKIYFLHARERPSIKMRCFQLGNILKKNYDLTFCDVEDPQVEKIENSIVYFFKHILATIKKVDFYELKKRNNVLVFDTIDLARGRESDISFDNEFFKGFDYIITPLIVLYNNNKHISKSRYIPHHYDIQLNNIKINPNKINKILYVGNNWYISGYIKLLDKVEKCFGFEEFHKNINFYSSFKYHISFYDNSVIDSKFKPITKVATAAAIDAVIICENSDENVFWLGNDYPFYIEMKNKKESIKYWIDKVEKDEIDDSLIQVARNKLVILKEKLNLLNIVNEYHIPMLQEINKRPDDSFVKIPKKDKESLKAAQKEKKSKKSEEKSESDEKFINSPEALKALKKLDIQDADVELKNLIKSMKTNKKIVLSKNIKYNKMIIRNLKNILKN